MAKAKKETKLTDHFTLEELSYTSKKDYKKTNLSEATQKKEQMQKLAEFAEDVRSVLGCPMYITSGYRCPALNKAVGGSKTSQHLKCEAVDFITKKMSLFEAFGRIIASDLKWGQLILELRNKDYLIHISIGTKREIFYSPGVNLYERK